MSHEELIATLQYCLAVIRSRLADERHQDQRWFWELRENVALYALRSQLHDLRDLEAPSLSAEQCREIIRSHPLLAPHQPITITPTGPEQETVQVAIRRKLAQTYLALPKVLPPNL